jgi:hypothetical protein
MHPGIGMSISAISPHIAELQIPTSWRHQPFRRRNPNLSRRNSRKHRSRIAGHCCSRGPTLTKSTRQGFPSFDRCGITTRRFGINENTSRSAEPDSQAPAAESATRALSISVHARPKRRGFYRVAASRRHCDLSHSELVQAALVRRQWINTSSDRGLSRRRH